ncbi:membrane protein insertion efficiency factor YidD [Candidatus Falkowbacteria bacterium HGW-Falkowbacteria-1]|uniref:Putative membrane protein insertion efficiency factor n=1 Tax=Candidatus Falkowbacteria bacterium HGW-Falkowbacteria-1 TaxID=2013768 RepID=A0A2N2E977_9BACT|nr:MAG: membrane protein insertion efficiency factor YidD [Candidatus Falkowbacteria bacterium HGW-Falkowbacteria-1]
MLKIFEFIYLFPRNLIIFFIKIYQKTFSLDHGPLKSLYPHGFCRFTPTCSQYGIDAVKKYGVVKGGAKACWRILRCNPFNKGGHDPVK